MPAKAAKLARIEGRRVAAKRCAGCDTVKGRAEFHSDERRVDGLYPWCKGCRRSYMGAKPQQPPRFKSKREYDIDYRAKRTAAERTAAARRKHLWTTFRITPEDYELMLQRQHGRCAVCGETQQKSSSKYGNNFGRFAVDHDHACCPGSKSCGRCVRGLLCQACNTGIGFLRDSPKILAAAMDYVENFRGVQCSDAQPLPSAG